MSTLSHKNNFAFFGSSSFSIYVLSALEQAGRVPSLIITTPDKPAGRKFTLTPTPVKVWAQQRNIPVLDPAKLNADFISTFTSQAIALNIQVAVVASYGKIIPQAVLDIPPRNTLNVHPSLLPKYRGASPVSSVILDDEKNTGVTIIRLDAEMDHGPILAQETLTIGTPTLPEWPTDEELQKILGTQGGALLAGILDQWILGSITEREQDHTAATFTKKIEKEDAEITIADITQNPYATFRKIQAYHGWPSAFFFISKNSSTKTTDTDKKIRVKITAASYDSTTDTLTIERIIPEGKTETKFEQFRANNRELFN
ncbi:MAG: hypothetical protein RIT04_143 [Candidatus Parcubacteria bacterium]